MAVTRTLIATRSFDDVPLTEILRRAGHSAGRFYGRFSGKEALFEELCRELALSEQALVRTEMAAWKGAGAQDLGRSLVLLIARLATRDRALHRSLLLRVWRDPGRHNSMATRMQDGGLERDMLSVLAGPRRLSKAREEQVRWLIAIVSDACRHEFLFGALADVEPDGPRARPFLDALAGMASRALTDIRPRLAQ